jgi:hypothetical protein
MSMRTGRWLRRFSAQATLSGVDVQGAGVADEVPQGLTGMLATSAEREEKPVVQYHHKDVRAGGGRAQ